MKEKIINHISGLANGNYILRKILTPIIALLFALMTALYIIVPLWLDKIFNIPGPGIGIINYFISVPLFITGLVLMVWSNVCFIKIKGTPVHINPPPELVTKGPFAYVRNPMHAGLFLLMFSFGIYFGSLLSVFIFTPLYIVIDIWFIKNIEEPELEKRLGDKYIQYKKSLPMFIPGKKKIIP